MAATISLFFHSLSFISFLFFHLISLLLTDPKDLLLGCRGDPDDLAVSLSLSHDACCNSYLWLWNTNRSSSSSNHTTEEMIGGRRNGCKDAEMKWLTGCKDIAMMEGRGSNAVKGIYIITWWCPEKEKKMQFLMLNQQQNADEETDFGLPRNWCWIMTSSWATTSSSWWCLGSESSQESRNMMKWRRETYPISICESRYGEQVIQA